MLVWTTWLLFILPELHRSLCQNIGSRCDYDQFTCRSGECVDEFYRCDGEKDCGDASDEAECHTEYERRCGGSNYFMCEGECRPNFMKCNDFIDCNDELDEAFCELPPSTPVAETSPPEEISPPEEQDVDRVEYPHDSTTNFNSYDHYSEYQVAAEPEVVEMEARVAEEISTTPEMPEDDVYHHQEDDITHRQENTEEAQFQAITEEDTFESKQEVTVRTEEETVDVSTSVSDRKAVYDIDNETLPIYKSLNTTPPTYVLEALPKGEETDDVVEATEAESETATEAESETATDTEDEYWDRTERPADSIQTNMHFEVVEENLLQQTPAVTEDLEAFTETDTTEPTVATTEFKEPALYTQSVLQEGVETLFSLLRHTPQSAMQTRSSILPKSLVDKAKDILRRDPEVLAVILDQLGEDVPKDQEKLDLLLNYSEQAGGDWISLGMAQNISRTQNDTLLQSALEIIYSLWEVVQDSALFLPKESQVPAQSSDSRQDVIASLFKVFEEEIRKTADMTSAMEAISSTTTESGLEAQHLLERHQSNNGHFKVVHTVSNPRMQNLVDVTQSSNGKTELNQPIVEEVSTTKTKEATEQSTEEGSTVIKHQADSSSTPGEDVTASYDEPISSTVEVEIQEKDDSEEDNGTDVTPPSDDQEDNEIEDSDARTADDINGQDDSAPPSTEPPSSPPISPTNGGKQIIQASTPNPQPCIGPGPVLTAADHHFCFKNQPYHPISAYIKLYPHSDVDSLHVYLVALQLTGGDLALIRLNPVLLRKVGLEKLAEFTKIATQMSIPLMFEIDMLDMSKMHEQLLVFSQTIHKQNSQILGWNFQVNNKTMWITNKYGVVRNVCVNDTINMQMIRKFREETKAFGHLLTITVTEDEPDFPINTTAKRVARRKCDYNPELWIDLTVELSDFQIFDPSPNTAMTPIFTFNKHVPLLLRSARVPVGEKHTGKHAGEYGYGGFIVNAESTVASFLMLRRFRNLIPTA